MSIFKWKIRWVEINKQVIWSAKSFEKQPESLMNESEESIWSWGMQVDEEMGGRRRGAAYRRKRDGWESGLNISQELQSCRAGVQRRRPQPIRRVFDLRRDGEWKRERAKPWGGQKGVQECTPWSRHAHTFIHIETMLSKQQQQREPLSSNFTITGEKR